MTDETDIKDKKNTEKQRCYSQKMDAVTLLAGNMAHDFNNQLTVINGYADILLEMIPDTQESYSMICEIRDAVMRSRELTEELLGFSRKKPLKTENVNINDVLDKLKNEISKTLSPTADLEVISDPELAEVKLDPARLEKAIMNLVTNAREAMPNGGKLTICTSNVEKLPSGAIPQSEESGEANRYVMLTVRDTGTGMDEQTIDRIFEPFFTIPQNGKGSGLGLSNVYGFIKQSGGKVEVQSKPAAGTTFRIYLPGVNGQ
jgi:two-component system, cell cycle sensor histidine kinase and response regulator CckA